MYNKMNVANLKGGENVEVCEEMTKLRNWLDDNKIRWEDRSEDFTERIGGEFEMWICRTHFKFMKKHISVINGYGGYGVFREDNEVMGLYEEVEGYLTAKELIDEMQKRKDLEEEK